MDTVIEKKNSIEKIKKILNDISFEPGEINPYLEKINSSQFRKNKNPAKLLLRPDVELEDLLDELSATKRALKDFSKENIEQASIQVKYEVYIEKEKELASRMSQLEDLQIPETFDYKKIQSLRK